MNCDYHHWWFLIFQMDDEACPELGLTLQNHFRAIDVRQGKSKHSKHRQSLITLSRRHSMVQMLDNIELDGPMPVRRISISNATANNHHNHHHHPSNRSADASMKRASVSGICQFVGSVELPFYQNF